MTKKDFEQKMAELRKNYMNNTIKDFEEKYNKEYIRLFKELNYDIKMRIKRYADDKGNIRVTYLNKIKSDLNDEMMRFNKEWGTLHKTLLEEASKRAFSDTKNLYSDMNMNMLSDQIKWNKDIMDYLINYKAQDGLTISKRLWGHSQNIKNGLMERISRNIMTGETVWDTMMELQQIKTPNVTIPKYLEDDFKKMNFEEIEKTIDLYTVKKGNYITQRLVEAETERAYRTTNLKLSEDKKWVKAMKWNLSARHNYGEKCSCEDNAEKDNFGMGKGVYPIKYYPHTPAHPWCKCYDTEVFTDECINEALKNNSQKNVIIDNGNDKQNTIKDDNRVNEFLKDKYTKKEMLTEKEHEQIKDFFDKTKWQDYNPKWDGNEIEYEGVTYKNGDIMPSHIYHYLKHGYKEMGIQKIEEYDKMALEIMKSADLYLTLEGDNNEFTRIHAVKEIIIENKKYYVSVDIKGNSLKTFLKMNEKKFEKLLKKKIVERGGYKIW
jgi:hypothetical protein